MHHVAPLLHRMAHDLVDVLGTSAPPSKRCRVPGASSAAYVDAEGLAATLLAADQRAFPAHSFDVCMHLTQLLLTTALPQRHESTSTPRMGRVLRASYALNAPAHSDETLPQFSTDTTSPLELPPSSVAPNASESESDDAWATPASMSSPTRRGV